MRRAVPAERRLGRRICRGTAFAFGFVLSLSRPHRILFFHLQNFNFHSTKCVFNLVLCPRCLRPLPAAPRATCSSWQRAATERQLLRYQDGCIFFASGCQLYFINSHSRPPLQFTWCTVLDHSPLPSTAIQNHPPRNQCQATRVTRRRNCPRRGQGFPLTPWKPL